MEIQFMIGNWTNKKERLSILKDRLLSILLRYKNNNGKQHIQIQLFHIKKLLLHQLLKSLTRQFPFLLHQYFPHHHQHQLWLNKLVKFQELNNRSKKQLLNGRTLSFKETLHSRLFISSSSLLLLHLDFFTLTSSLTRKRK